MAVQDACRLSRVRRARYVVESYLSARGEQEGGLFKDHFFDDLLREIGEYFKIESLNNKAFLPRSDAALIRSDLTTSLFELVSGFLARTGCAGRVRTVAESLSQCLHQELGPNALTSGAIERTILRFLWAKRLYSWLLKRIDPEFLLVADPGEHDIVAAAKERGVVAIEFQHGFVDRNHSSYSWSAYAARFRRCMPIPDRLFIYGTHWEEELVATGFWREEICVVGSPRIDQYRAVRSTAEPMKDIALVVTAQGTDSEALIAFLLAFLSLVGTPLPFHLYVKLHPVYDTSRQPYDAAFLPHRNVHVLLGSEPPSTFELLARAHLHASIASTCHYEALGLGVPTVILPLSGYENVLHLYHSGHAFLAQTPRDLSDIVQRLHNMNAPVCSADHYFRPDAIENIKRELGL
jgi:hypothetical protein